VVDEPFSFAQQVLGNALDVLSLRGQRVLDGSWVLRQGRREMAFGRGLHVLAVNDGNSAWAVVGGRRTLRPGRGRKIQDDAGRQEDGSRVADG
jgi:hypothetical protein